MIRFRHHKLRSFLHGAGRVPYWAALYMVQSQVEIVCPSARVWARNSFLTDAFRPFKSDLDLTLWLPAQTNNNIDRELFCRLERAKRVFPALGEANVYREKTVLSFVRFANQFELRRDPQTCLRFRMPHLSAEARNAQVSTYLLRMLESNIQLLKEGWRGQEVKWLHHLRRVDVEPTSVVGKPDPIRGILNCALRRAQVTDSGIDQVYAYMQGGEATRIVQVLFPNRFCYLELPRELLIGQMRELFLAQIAWEIWGLYGQQLLYKQKTEFAPHIRRLMSWLAQLDDEAATSLKSGLEDLVAIIEGSNPKATSAATASVCR